MSRKIVLIEGDGIGKEVISAAKTVLMALALPDLVIEEAEAGYGTYEKYGNALPGHTLSLCEISDAILFGATQSPLGEAGAYKSPILSLRNHFDLYANLRPCIGNGIDLMIVRENTEGLYSKRERLEDNGKTAIAERVITRFASERITRRACQIASTRKGHLTIVHKSNVLKLTCGLFRETAFEVAEGFPNLRVDEKLVDAMALSLVENASVYDVIVTTNLFGDILSDLTAGLCGGIGLAPSANIGDAGPALFEPVHGSAPDIAGQGIADPRAAFLSLAMALHHMGYEALAKALQQQSLTIAHSGKTALTTEQVIEGLNHYVGV
ncbi:isocitrate/isopropylmalate dehydrogenase family protein [Anaerolineales bacterium]